jgi:sec-independent protein translocase protein TatC
LTFWEHLEELRKRIFYSLIAIGVGATIGFIFAGRLVTLLTRPVPNLVFLAPAEAFVVQLKVALVAGLFIAAPVLFYQFWRFVRPALGPREAKFVVMAVPVTTALFAAGVAFAWLVIVPTAMKFLLSFETPKLHAMISINEYVGTVGAFLFACGVIFQLPVIMFFLAKLGVVSARFLMKHQRAAIVAIFVVAAVLSPPDVFSQVLMAIPLFVLFEVSVLAAYIARPAAGRKPEA